MGRAERGTRENINAEPATYPSPLRSLTAPSLLKHPVIHVLVLLRLLVENPLLVQPLDGRLRARAQVLRRKVLPANHRVEGGVVLAVEADPVRTGHSGQGRRVSRGSLLRVPTNRGGLVGRRKSGQGRLAGRRVAHFARCVSVRHEPMTDHTPGTALGSLQTRRGEGRGTTNGISLQQQLL